MDLGRALLKDIGVEPAWILQQSFGGAVAEERHGTSTPGSLEIKFSRSALAGKVSPDETLLESSKKGGLIPSGYRQGACGTCTARLLTGKVHMETAEALNEQLRSQGFILPVSAGL